MLHAALELALALEGSAIRNCTLTKTANGVRVKDHREQPVVGIMNNVSNPIIINQNYCSSNLCKSSLQTRSQKCKEYLHRNIIICLTINLTSDSLTQFLDFFNCLHFFLGSKVPSRVRISDVLFQDIQGTSTAEMAMQLTCSQSMLRRNVKLRDIGLKYIGMNKNAKNAIS
ncbi:hypothetical protein Cgig2_014216 [Carnegiea gigantea]|uniref:Uncharacterized protein n=1 Tax=Carnegiea gigantea TaxID=171969 RepID=A0A9Q1H083_9CARY|nr:hypothetical protein Cgig2_014216 [Carnegiea gigantea]